MIRKLATLVISIALFVSVSSCSKGPKKPSKTQQPLPKIGIEAGHPALAAAAREVVKKCEVSRFGSPKNCTDNAGKNLREKEREVGHKEAIRTYCLALHDPDKKVKALGAAQLHRLARPRAIKRSADSTVLSCLLGELRATHPFNVVRTVAKAAAFMATALGSEPELLAILQEAKSDVAKSTGYGALWANGRMRVMKPLARVLQESRSAMVRVAIIEGFFRGGKLDEDERQKVCQVLAPLMTDEDTLVAGAAANRVAGVCPEAREQVIQAAEAQINKNRFSAKLVTAVHRIDGSGKRGIRILSQVLGDRRVDDSVRALSLRKINELDGTVGQRLARKHIKSRSSHLRSVAEEVTRTKTR